MCYFKDFNDDNYLPLADPDGIGRGRRKKINYFTGSVFTLCVALRATAFKSPA